MLLQKLTLVQACNLKVCVFVGHATDRDKLGPHSVLVRLAFNDTSQPRQADTLITTPEGGGTP